MADGTTTASDLLEMVISLGNDITHEKNLLESCACTRETFGVDDRGVRAADVLGRLAEARMKLTVDAAKDLMRIIGVKTSYSPAELESRLAALPTPQTYDVVRAEHRALHAEGLH